MHNNSILFISPNIRIIILFILISILFITESIYLILFLTTLTLILYIITNVKVNSYVKLTKKLILLLLIFVLAYIIIFEKKDVILIVIFIYKLLLSLVLIEIFAFNINFGDTHRGIYGILLPLNKFNVDIEKISFNIAISLYFIKLILYSDEKIKYTQSMINIRKRNIKNFFIPRFVYSINQLYIYQNNLKIKHYALNYKKSNLKSKILFMIFFIMFIICICKEVM